MKFHTHILHSGALRNISMYVIRMCVYYPHAYRVFSRISLENARTIRAWKRTKDWTNSTLQVLQFMTCRNVHVDIWLDSLINIVRR